MGSSWSFLYRPSLRWPFLSSPSPPPPWSDLPHDLLVRLARNYTSCFDLAPFAGVCKSWRRAAAAVATAIPSLPYLTIHRCEWGYALYWYGLCDKKMRRLLLPREYYTSWRCWGSSHGWLAMSDMSAGPFLFNPITGARINLPNFKTLPELSRGPRDSAPDMPYHVCDINGYCGAFYDFEEKNIGNSFAVKLNLSAAPTDPSCVAMTIYTRYRRLAYARPGDRSWTPLRLPLISFLDVAFYGGRFWAYSCNNFVFSIDAANFTYECFHSGYRQIASRRRPRGLYRTCLVAIPSGVALVRRYHGITEAGHYGTIGFEVFLLVRSEEHRGNWVELANIGECSLLLGHNHTLCAPASGLTAAYMPNCIYFMDEVDGLHDIGIFHIQDATFRPCITAVRNAISPMWITVGKKSWGFDD